MISLHFHGMSLEHKIVLKVGVALGIAAAVFVPPPWNHVVGVGTNMVWLFGRF